MFSAKPSISLLFILCAFFVSHTIVLAEGLVLETVVQTGHSSVILSVAFSPDGKYVVTGSADNTTKLWDVETGNEIRTFSGHAGDVRSVGFSPDGGFIITGSNDKSARMWDVLTGEEFWRLEWHNNYVTSVSFSPDGKKIVTGSKDKTAILWDVAAGERLTTLKGHTGYVTSVAFSPDSRYVVTGSYDCTARIWDVETGRLVRVFKGVLKEFFRGFIKGMLKGFLKGHYESITAVAYSPDGRYIVTGSEDKTARLWDVRKGEEVRIFKGHTDYVTSVNFSSDGRYLVTGSLDKTTKIWDLKMVGAVYTFGDHPDYVTSVAFSPDGKYIISASGSFMRRMDKTARLWEISSKSQVRTFEGQSHWGNSVNFSDDGRYIATVFGDGSTKLWDIVGGGKVRPLKSPFNDLLAVDFSLAGRYLFTRNINDVTRVCDITTGRIISIHNEVIHAICCVALSPDERYLVTGSLDYTAKLWDVETGEEIRIFYGHDDCVFSVNFSPDSKYIFTGSGDRTAKIWDVETGEEIKTISGHAYAVTSVAFSPDSRFVVTGSMDGLTNLWEVRSGRHLAKLIPVGEKDWAVTTPEGFFDASDGAKEHVHFVRGYATYEMDQFFEDFYRPNLLPQLTGRDGAILPRIDITRKIAEFPPPVVRIVSPRRGERLEQKTIDVKVQVTDSGGGIDEIKLMHNSKRIEMGTWGSKREPQRFGKSVIYNFRVPLVSGDNTLVASAFSRGRIESRVDKLDILLVGGEKEAVLYTIVIGIDEYNNNALNLNYAVRNASAFADLIKRKSRKLFQNVEVLTLYNIEATRSNLMNTLDYIAQIILPEDMLIIYYTGHGSVVGDDFYLITSDNLNIRNRRDLERDALNVRELQDKLKIMGALNQLLVIDVDQPGASLKPLGVRGSVEEKILAQLARSTGVRVLASAGWERSDAEYLEDGYSLFSHVLLNGLRGEADVESADFNITVKELSSYLDIHVPELTEKRFGEAKYPILLTQGPDFSLISR